MTAVELILIANARGVRASDVLAEVLEHLGHDTDKEA